MVNWELIPAFDRREELQPLYAEYEAMLLEADPTFIRSLNQQNYGDEIAHLEEKYALPRGRFYLLSVDGAIAGCVGMKPLDEAHAELKRLYVRPAYRGNGFGEKLTRRILDDARQEGYRFVRLDTLPSLRTALSLYRRLGFYEIPAYYDCLIPDTIFLEYRLTPSVRDATPEDAARLAEIYSYYVENTAITYEYVTPTPEAFRTRIENTQRRYPYLVAEENGVILGYAYAGPLVTRPAADWSCEVSIYLDRGARGRGLGRMLYAALEEALKRMGICNIYALVALPDTPDEYLDSNSADFHTHLGFREAGRLHHCGHKFGRWYNLLYMEKQIGQHALDMPPIRSYKASKETEP